MPCMPEHISKPPIIVRLDRQLSTRGGQQALLDELRNDIPLEEALDRLGLLHCPNFRGIDERRHLRDDWFTPKGNGGWWNSREGEIEGTIRGGLTQAIEQAIELAQRQSAEVPVDTVWICAGHDESHHHDTGNGGQAAAADEVEVMQVQCFVLWNQRQVSLMILTPEEPHGTLDQFQKSKKHAAPWHHDHKAEDVRPDVYNRYTDAEKRRDRGMLVIKPNADGDLLTKPVDRVVTQDPGGQSQVQSVDEILVAPLA